MMPDKPQRQPISKKTRFEVFKRDKFTCQYCGRTPPTVVLEVDHVVSVRDGGSSELHNLLTSCFDCNRGKGADALGVVPAGAAERAAELKERIEQAKEYEKLLRKERARKERAVAEIAAIYEDAFEDWTLTDSARNSIKMFIEKLPRPVIEEAMEKACTTKASEFAFKYFCGICWNIIKGPGR